MVQHHIRRIHEEVVDRQAEQRHQDRADERADQRALAALHLPVDKTRREDKHRAEDEVAQLAHARARAERQVDDVLGELDGDAVDRAERERPEQGREVGDVELDKRGHDGNRELNELQHKGHSRQHGRHGDVVGLLSLAHRRGLDMLARGCGNNVFHDFGLLF